MRKILHLTLLSSLLGLSTFAQRTMEIVSEDLFSVPFPELFKSVEFDHSVIIQTAFGRLYKVTDRDLTAYPYPAVPGGRLYYTPNYELAVYNSSIYMVFERGADHVLYRFDGTNYYATPIPGEIVSSPTVFQGNLYVLSDFHGLVQLYRYDGHFVDPVPSASLVRDVNARYDLRIAGDHLYFSVFALPIGAGSGFSTVKRYDGVGVFTIPAFPFLHGLSQIEEITSTGEVYFITQYGSLPGIGRHIYYFNGTSVTDIYEGGARSPVSGVLWRNDLYFLDPDDGRSSRALQLRKADGSRIITTPLPAGSSLYGQTNLVVFNDAVCLPVSACCPGEYRVLSYNGFSFSTIFSVPGGFDTHAIIFLRGGKLIIQPSASGRISYEYDGTSSITITAPVGYGLSVPLYFGATPCNYFWMGQHTSYGSLLKEPICPFIVYTPVIPRYFQRFSLFSTSYSASARTKSWSNISAGWLMNADCKEPNCSAPSFLLTLSDAQNQIAWQQKFDKPFIAAIPGDDKIPLKATLSSTEQGLQDLVLMDQDVVERGIDRIAFSFYSKNGSFLLGATTRDGMSVPLRVSLLNKQGKSIWEKEFIAPFLTNITDKVTEPGEILRFSVRPMDQTNSPDVTQAMSFNYINPSHGTVTIETKASHKITDAEVTVCTILGQKLITKRISNSTRFRLELPPYQPGIFVISMKTKEGRVVNRMVYLK